MCGGGLPGSPPIRHGKGRLMRLPRAGKTAVVPGAGKGIGLAIARALAGEGVQVVAGAREGTDQLTKLAADTGVRPLPVDLGTVDGPSRLVDEAVEAFGGLDI